MITTSVRLSLVRLQAATRIPGPVLKGPETARDAGWSAERLAVGRGLCACRVGANVFEAFVCPPTADG